MTAIWQESIRVAVESAFAATLPTTLREWNHGLASGNGLSDLPVMADDAPLTFKPTVVPPVTKAGVRSMHTALPVAGSFQTGLGTLNAPVYLELMHPMFYAALGGFAAVETAGAAVLNTVAFNSLSATLDTQSNGTEQLKFVIADSTGSAAGATITIVQSATVQETITIASGAAGASLDGTYYSKGRYNGSSAAITITTTGDLTSATTATIAATGVDYSTNTYTLANTTPSLFIEQQGRLEAGAGNDQFFRGCTPSTLTLAYDASDPASMLMAAMNLMAANITKQAGTTYANDAATYYRPIMGWNGAVTFDGGANTEIISMSLNLNNNNEIYKASSGDQYATGKEEGTFEVSGEIVLRPADSTRLDDYEANTVRDVDITFTSAFYVVDTTAYSLLIELPQLVLTDYTPDHQNQGQGATVSFVGVYESAHSGGARLTSVCGRSIS